VDCGSVRGGQRRPDTGRGSASTADMSTAVAVRTLPQSAVVSTADRPATADRRWMLRPSSRRLSSSGQHTRSAVRSPALVKRPGRRKAGGQEHPAGADTGHAFGQPQSGRAGAADTPRPRQVQRGSA
jgi:hypothetical protein